MARDNEATRALDGEGHEPHRAGTYALLGRLLAAPPDEDVLAILGQLGDDGAEDPGDGLADAWRALREMADDADLEALDEEYHELFIGLPNGEIIPYHSWYQEGTLMGQPLLQVRQDLGRLGLETRDGVSEPEDHAAALCEIMAYLIRDEEVPFVEQQRFFRVHLEPWMERFFTDVRTAESAQAYRAVGLLGERFMELERRYFSMLA